MLKFLLLESILTKGTKGAKCSVCADFFAHDFAYIVQSYLLKQNPVKIYIRTCRKERKWLDRNDRLNLENCLLFFYLVLGWQVSLNCLIALNLLNDLELTCSLLVGVFWRADWPGLQDSWVLESLPLNNLIPQMISTFLLILVLKITRSMKKIFPIERPISVIFITSRQDAMLWSYRWQCQLLRQNKTVDLKAVNSFTTLGCRTPLSSFPCCLLSQNVIKPCFHAAKLEIIRNHLWSDDQGREAYTSFRGYCDEISRFLIG